MAKRDRLVFVPLPQVGHLVAAVELAKLVLNLPATAHRFSVTILSIPPFQPSPELSSFISATSFPNLSFLHLPPISPPLLSTIPPRFFILAMLNLYRPVVLSALRDLHSSSPVSALVFDFCSNMLDLGLLLRVPSYVFSTSSASFLGFFLHFPSAIDPLLPSDGRAFDMEGRDVLFPGFASKVPLQSFPDSVSFGKDEAYEFVLRLGRQMREASGFLVNSFDELQRGATEALVEGRYLPGDRIPPVYNIGPLLSLPPDPDHECLRWLDRQPSRSVVFLCFGSRGRFTKAQVAEVAIALERSGHGFLWVLRAPAPEKENASSLALEDAALDEVLPERFAARTAERGLVWPSFAPQAEILRHAAVGGFVTHCGWNSCLEAVWFGVPMAAWPLYAEQHWNAFEMVREMGVAVEVKVERTRGNWASAEEVERAVRQLMGEGGEGVRRKVLEMKEKARKAVEEGGPSQRALRRAAEAWAAGDGIPSV